MNGKHLRLARMYTGRGAKTPRLIDPNNPWAKREACHLEFSEAFGRREQKFSAASATYFRSTFPLHFHNAVVREDENRPQGQSSGRVYNR